MNKNINFRRGNIGLILGGVLTIAAIAVAGFFLWQKSQVKSVSIEVSWEKCIKDPTARIMESYPMRCVTDDGRYAVQPLPEEEKKKLQVYKYPVLNYSFEYPIDWKIKEGVGPAGDKSVEILDPSGERMILFNEFLGGTGCLESPPNSRTSFQIGTETINWLDFCGTKNFYLRLESLSGQEIKLEIYFVGQNEESTAREILKTVEGLKIVDEDAF